jgi:hypothetical protein
MEKLIKYRQIICDVLISYTEIPYSHGELTCNPIFDESRDSYLLVTFGWDRKKRVHDSLIHVDIIDDKIWIHCDDTEDGVANQGNRTRFLTKKDKYLNNQESGI